MRNKIAKMRARISGRIEEPTEAGAISHKSPLKSLLESLFYNYC